MSPKAIRSPAAHPPGRALDVAVALAVMGYRREECPRYAHGVILPKEYTAPAADAHFVALGQPYDSMVPKYSTEITPAWEVVEKVLADFRDTFIIGNEEGSDGPYWEVELYDRSDGDGNRHKGGRTRQAVIGSGETAAHAICRAALWAVE